jgi:acyl-CoA reductase-like NAD-dependent aldehyde dehydrogenase
MAKEKSGASTSKNGRLGILKTYKLFIGGGFPRTESGRSYSPVVGEKAIANMCLASRKDARNAIVAARTAQPAWAGRTAYNRTQILYRIGEMLEGRRDQFISELQLVGMNVADARAEVDRSIDRLIYYAGWCDKFQQVFSSVNPVASSHFNFSVLEPGGVVFVVANEESPLLGLVSLLAPIIASGNTCVVLASESKPVSAITFGEVLQTSDLPGGVVNILTGNLNELLEHFAKHLDVNHVAFNRRDEVALKQIQQLAVGNVKRVRNYDCDWSEESSQGPWLIHDFCEVKTTWHPIEKISETGASY